MQEVFSNIEFVAPDKFNKEYSNFSSHIEGSTHVGNYTDPEGNSIIIAAVQLKSRAYVENSRSVQRNYAKKLIENAASDAAFVAFFTEGESKWRISFVRLDYEMKFENGKMKTSENLTPAKRYSYLVGRDEPCHTAIDRFKIFIVDNNSMPTLDQMEDVFSVEAVTNEFFKLYCEKFHQVREHLESNEDFVEEAKQHNFTSAQFTKKLMGQIVFLYFLQKKGWLGVNALPKTMTEKEYKNAFFARGAKSRAILPVAYKQNPEDGLYYLMPKGLATLNNEDETILAQCVKGQPWGTGPQNFMRKLFETSQKKGANFFDDYLEPLFYNALNVNRGEQGYDPILHCRIPFLSGGLFEPIDGYEWEYNDFGVPNELFSNRINNNPRTGDGILDIFDRYNFTMSEDEPLEREVAIDPEMLGKVFENLLDVNDRKSKGAFYTPREIVHYMCQESLINYLTREINVSEDAVRDFILYGDFMKGEDTVKEKRQGNGTLYISEELYKLDNNGNVVINKLVDMDKALADVRVADPAVGSGAFPLGMLNEIVRARQNISAYYSITMNPNQTRLMYSMERSPYALKYQTIKNCIYAADIDPSAVDIAQLRLWLSLVIDDEINPNADPSNPLDGHRNPTPLPNLECNILCGNSLIDEFEGIKLINQDELLGTATTGAQTNIWGDSFSNILPRLIDAQDRLFHCDDTNKKHEILNEISAIKDMIILSQMEGVDSEIVERYKESKKLASKPYVLWQLDFSRVFKEKGGFDIVIGNPPYIGEEGHKEIFQEIAKTNFGEKYYTGKMDFWYFFTSKGIELLRNNGLLSFIAPNNWMTTAGGKNMRKHIATSTMLLNFTTFNNVMIFESASQQTMIFLLMKQVASSSYSLNYNAVGNRALSSDSLRQFISGKTIGEHFKAAYNPLKNADGRTIQFLDEKIALVTEKIAKGGNLFLNNDEVLNGIHPHHAEVTKKMLNVLPDANVGDGIFVLKNKEIEDMSIPSEEEELLKPYYDTSSIGRYYFDSTIKAKIIYTQSMFKDTSLMEKYPTIRKHLDKYEKVITSDNRPYGLHRARKQEFFDNPKVCALRKCKTPIFSYVNSPAYVTAEWYVIMTDRVDLKYLTCLLNSRIIKFWLLKMGKMQGSVFQVDKDPLVKIPIIKPNRELEANVIRLYEQLVKIRCEDKDANISAFEEEIDELFYRAYELDEYDRLVIEDTLSDWDNR